MNIDLGASVNIIDSEVFEKLKGRKDVKLSKTKNKVFGYGSKTPLDVQGCFEAQVESKHKISLATFYVINDTSGCLLSGPTAIDLGLLKINSVSQDPEPSVDKPPADTPKRPPRLKNFLAKHDHLFRGIGKLKNYKLHLHIDKSVPPVVQQPRRIPFAMRAKLSKELKRVPSGYHQLELDEESRDLTTFVTHKGLKRFTRLNFGTNSASEIFQNVIQTTFQDIECMYVCMICHKIKITM